MRRHRAAIHNWLLPQLAPSGVNGWIIRIGRLAVDDVARTEIGEELRRLRVIGLVRLFHCIEMVEDAVELVEAVNRWKEFVAIAKMVLTDLCRGVAVRLEQF